MTADRIWLDVPYAEKDEAKTHGARWDPQARRWYAPQPGISGLARWEALPDVPDLLPGEDRSWGDGLFVDLVPSSCWFTNVRSCVSERDWERLRRMITNRAGRRCEVCGRPADRESARWLEAHERWAYDSAALVQSLRRLICLCTDCHRTTHFGLASIKGQGGEALRHLQAVTGLSEYEAREHVDASFEIWQRRSLTEWTLDLGILTNAGITVKEPPPPDERTQVADRTLGRFLPGILQPDLRQVGPGLMMDRLGDRGRRDGGGHLARSRCPLCPRSGLCPACPGPPAR